MALYPIDVAGLCQTWRPKGHVEKVPGFRPLHESCNLIAGFWLSALYIATNRKLGVLSIAYDTHPSLQSHHIDQRLYAFIKNDMCSRSHCNLVLWVASTMQVHGCNHFALWVIIFDFKVKKKLVYFDMPQRPYKWLLDAETTWICMP